MAAPKMRTLQCPMGLGKYYGVPVGEVKRLDPAYFEWAISKGVIEIVTELPKPAPPTAALQAERETREQLLEKYLQSIAHKRLTEEEWDSHLTKLLEED